MMIKAMKLIIKSVLIVEHHILLQKRSYKEDTNKRVEVGDALAMHNLGMFYSEGLNGYTEDYRKALEYWHEAGELGDARAHGNMVLHINMEKVWK